MGSNFLWQQEHSRAYPKHTDLKLVRQSGNSTYSTAIHEQHSKGILKLDNVDTYITVVKPPPGCAAAYQLLHHSMNCQVVDMIAKIDANLAQSPTFRYVCIE
ncbi:hypothetical protein TNCV_73931 [Trichonephila clavipes]|nr:hypothetical protein TNCV_73931 [Trichonephila clavipes]